MTRTATKPRWLVVSAAVALVTVPGCGFVDEQWPMWWHDGVVVRTMHRSELPSDIDAGCVPAAAGSGHDASLFALVQFRVGRAPYSKLLPIADNEPVQAGDPVFVDPSACKVRPRAPGERKP